MADDLKVATVSASNTQDYAHPVLGFGVRAASTVTIPAGGFGVIQAAATVAPDATSVPIINTVDANLLCCNNIAFSFGGFGAGMGWNNNNSTGAVLVYNNSAIPVVVEADEIFASVHFVTLTVPHFSA